jgi:hypothetical protein
MGDVNTRCVSPDAVPLGPDLRVNYEFGLVLGVDEFRQEQRYFLEKDWLHDRALHGYGTVYGLHVDASPPPDDANDILVNVGPGMGVDQWGRPVVIRSAQCARLGAWLAAREKAEPGSAASHKNEAGQVVVYVVAAYDECLDALVPIPGQPCSSSEQQQAASRIRDSARIELRWAPPAMPAWDAVRVVADLLARVEIDPALAADGGDEAAIVKALREMDPAGTGPLLPGASPKLPAADLRVTLDRIFAVWVTEVRPRFAPPLTEPNAGGPPAVPNAGEPPAEPGILLATLRFTAADPFDTAAPVITQADPADDTGRPFLLHTQLLQELVALGWRGGAAAAPVPPPVNARELVSFDTLTGDDERVRILAWFHLDKPVRLPEQLEGRRGANADLVTFKTSAVDGNPFAVVWELIPEDERLRDGDLLAFRFPTDTVMVADDQLTLGRFIEEGGLELVGHDEPDTVWAYYVVELEPPVSAAPAPHEHPHEHAPEALGPTQPLATINAFNNDGRLEIELWFHVDIDPRIDEARVGLRGRRGVTVLAETEENTPREIKVARWAPVRHNVYSGQVNSDAWKEQAEMSPYLRFVFSTGLAVTVEGNDMPLVDLMNNRRVRFEGYDGGEQVCVYVRVQPGRLG